MQSIKERVKIQYEFLMKGLLLFLLVFIPFRNILETLLGTYIKLIPDIAILLLILFFPILYKEKIKIKSYDICFGMFLLVAFINTVFIQQIGITLYIFEVRSIIIYYLLFFVIRNFEFSSKYKLLLCKVIRYITYILFVLGLVEKLSRKTVLFPKSVADSIIYEDNFARVYSMFFNPNTYGAFLVLSFFIVLYFEKKQLLMYKITVMVSLLLSMSRSSILLLMFFLVMYAVVIERKTILKNKIKVCGQVLFVLLVSLSCYTVCEYTADKFWTAKQEKSQEYVVDADVKTAKKVGEDAGNTAGSSTVTKQNGEAESNAQGETEQVQTPVKEKTTTVYDRIGELNTEEIVEKSQTDGRLFFLMKGIEIFKDYPILGTGFGTYGSAASMNWEPPIYEEYGLPYGFYADNEYIKDLVETGLVGVILFGAFLLSILYAYRTRHFAVLFCIAVGWFGLFYNVFEVQIVAYLLWLLLGIESKRNENEKDRI